MTIPVFYCKAMNAHGHGFSPSAGKPRLVADALRRSTLPVMFVEPVPLTPDQIARAHDPQYVRGVFNGDRLNGFGNTSVDVARSLPYTNGAIVDAAVIAYREGIATAALASGFHHASYFGGGGFCTFNGLVLAALRVLDEGAVRVAIIDADAHDGNGTRHIIEHLGLEHQIFHYSFGGDFFCFGELHDQFPDQAQAYLDRVSRFREDLAVFAPSVIIYQAGADAHRDDPLGGILTTSQLRERDRRMFRVAADLKIGIAWTLAGGYQRNRDGAIPKVIDIHLNTFQAAAEVFGR